jgi:hypothetical protein
LAQEAVVVVVRQVQRMAEQVLLVDAVLVVVVGAAHRQAHAVHRVLAVMDFF